MKLDFMAKPQSVILSSDKWDLSITLCPQLSAHMHDSESLSLIEKGTTPPMLRSPDYIYRLGNKVEAKTMPSNEGNRVL